MQNVAFSGSTMNRTQVPLWYNWFKEGREYVNDDARPDHPTRQQAIKNIEKGKKMILNNCRIYIMEVADIVRLMPNNLCGWFWT